MAITSPLEISDCTLWLDSTDPTKVSYQQLDAGELALIGDWGDGSPKSNLRIFSSWTDKSTSGVVISQTSWRRPRIAVNVAAMGGNPCIRFDGGGSLIIPGSLINYNSCSVFFVGLSENTTDNPLFPGGCFLDTESGIEQFGFYIRPDSTFAWKIGRGDGPGTILASTEADQNAHIFGFQMLKGYGDISLDGNNVKLGVCSLDGDVDALSIGARSGAKFYQEEKLEFLKGYIGEVIFYNRAINTVEKNDVLSYLQSKWSTPALP